jgi:hypothetical protein
MSTRNLTLRLPEDTYRLTETVALVEGASVSEVVRQAVDRHLDTYARDDDFLARLRELQAHTLELLAARADHAK